VRRARATLDRLPTGQLLADLKEQLQRTLSGTYTLERELGGGGMSRVFLAEEVRFRRKVAIKLLPADFAGTINAERFEREIQMVARLQHTNILPLLTAGEAGGLLYYTMPFVEGESLRERISREGRLPVAESLRIASEVADALACAHRGGLVHRDIKPENILLSAGHAVVADFGIAKAIAASRTMPTDPNDEVSLTQVGTSLGTPAYMSPEQAVGEQDLDGRTDIYSLGCTLYEMIAGCPPFSGTSAPAVIAKRFTHTPSLLRTLNSAIPVEVERLVARATEREPANRFATADQLLAALSSAIAAPSGRLDVDDTPSVAVLPFANLSANADDEYFSDGMTDEVMNTLSHLQGIRVAARTSSFAFKGQRVDLREVARQLGVQSILEGSVRRAGSRVRISVQLVSATDGLQIWSDKYDRELADVFALQDEIAAAIGQALQRELAGGTAIPTRIPPAQVARPPRGPINPAAYDVYLRGRFLFEQHQPLDAIGAFERAIALEPDFALAHTGYSWANMLAANLNMLPAATGFPRAREAAERALALEPDQPEALLTQAFVAWWFDWDMSRAWDLNERVLALAPGFSNAHELRALILVAGGRFEEGVESIEYAYALDPLSNFMLYDLGLTLNAAGKPARVIEVVREALLRTPGNGGLHLVLGTALYLLNRLPEACAALEKGRELTRPSAQLRGTLVCTLAAMGNIDVARSRLSEMEDNATDNTGSSMEIACGYAALGELDVAFSWLERAFEARSLWMTFLHLEPRLRPLWGMPRFEALVKRVGVAPRENPSAPRAGDV
jgi:serine/threonine protein kinase/cytochrome c-type biogenesis protein CcmH/NrfG